MTQARLSDRERRVIVPCAGLALLLAAVTPFVWPDIALRFGDPSPTLWTLNLLLWTLPTCLALVAVVLTARLFVGVAIAVACTLVADVAWVVNLFADGLSFDLRYVLEFLFWTLVMASALLAADLMARRLGAFTAVTGALAGLAVGVVLAFVKLAQLTIDGYSDMLGTAPTSYWLNEYAAPAGAFVLTGLLAGAIAQRLALRQETAGVA